MRMAITPQSSSLLAVLTAVLLSGSADAVEKPDAKSSTAPSATGLIAALDKRYEDAYRRRSAEEWSQLLQLARTMDDKRFDLTARDRLAGDLRRFVKDHGDMKRDLRIVICEVVDQNGPNAAKYDRAAVYFYRGTPSKELISLSKMGLVELSPQKFKTLEDPLLRAMKAKGSNNGVRSVSDATESLVLTCFDGIEWREETWFWIVTGAYLSVEEGRTEPRKRESLPDSLRCLIEILEVMQPYGSDGRGFGPSNYRDLLKDFPNAPPATPATNDHNLKGTPGNVIRSNHRALYPARPHRVRRRDESVSVRTRQSSQPRRSIRSL